MEQRKGKNGEEKTIKEEKRGKTEKITRKIGKCEDKRREKRRGEERKGKKTMKN